LSLDEAKTDDIKTTANEVDILIPHEVKVLAEGNTINYINEPYNEGFTIGRSGYSSC
jgi:Fe-S cluster assembly iron-binding protein IscA